jgi:hypothetical protein
MFKFIGMFFDMLQTMMSGTHKYVSIYEKSADIAVQKMDIYIAEQAVEAARLKAIADAAKGDK